MSFQEQERALFDLLFDQSLRGQFCERGIVALSDYALDENERDDFNAIRPDALALDATMRIYLILTHICKSYPISFCLISSLQDGNSLLKSLVDVGTMRAKSADRTTVFGKRLREKLATFEFDVASEKDLIIAILEAELGMAWTGASLKQLVIEQGQLSEGENQAVAADWLTQPINLASYVSVAIIPHAYGQLKQSLCPCSDAELWAQLSRQPLTKSIRSKALNGPQPRLLVSRARVSNSSRCEPTVDHKTVELSEGFAHLFQYVNGSHSVEQILAQLKQAGAADKMLDGVQSGFRQLLETGMLTIAK